MTSLGKEFEVYRQLKPPFPPGFLDRLLVHLGDELITSEGESTIRLFAMPPHVSMLLLEWLFSYSHLLPTESCRELFCRVDQFIQIEKDPPFRLSFSAQIVLDQIRSALGNTQADPATEKLVQAWMMSQAGQLKIQESINILNNDSGFEAFKKMLRGQQQPTQKNQQDAMDLDFDIAIDFEDEDGAIDFDTGQKQSQEDLMELDASQPFGFASQGGDVFGIANTIKELPEEVAAMAEAARTALAQLESADQLSTQSNVDLSVFSFLLSIPENLLPLVYEACTFANFSESVVIQFIDCSLIGAAKDLSFSRAAALLRVFIVPFFKNMKSQPSRNVMASSVKLLKTHSECFIEACLVPLAVDSALFDFQAHHADFIFKVLSDASMTTEQLQRFVTLFLGASSNLALAWMEPLFDLTARVFTNPKMKFSPTIVQLFSIEIGRQTNEAASTKRVVPKIVTAINEIVKKSSDMLATLPRTVASNLRDALKKCDTAAANVVLKKIEPILGT